MVSAYLVALDWTATPSLDTTTASVVYREQVALCGLLLPSIGATPPSSEDFLMREYRHCIRLGFLSCLVSTSVLTSGCGPNCQSTCNALYLESECNIQVPGITREVLLSRCNSACEDALEIPGEAGNYAPNERTKVGQTVNLQNDIQAAMWMDCIGETACENIEDGYCEPVTF